MSGHIAESEEKAGAEGLETLLGADAFIDSLASAFVVKGAIHNQGLIGGIGLKVLQPDPLHSAVADRESKLILEKLVVTKIQDALQEAGISYGVKDEAVQQAVDDFVASLSAGDDSVITRKIAEGEAAEAGRAGHIEYPLNYKGHPFRELATLKANSSRKQCTVVHAQDVLAILQPPEKPKPGVAVTGEAIDAKEQPQKKGQSLEEIAGEGTVISSKNVLALSDGMCEEDAMGRLRVVPVIVVKQVDEASGAIPETGVSAANVEVVGDMRARGVATTETLFVGTESFDATIEGHAAVHARNMVLAGRAVGESEGRTAPMVVDDICVLGEVVNRSISARRIYITRDCHFAHLDGEDGIWVDGNLRGGLVQCRNFLQVYGDLGTENGGSHTRISLPNEPVSAHHLRKIAKGLKKQKDQLQELQAQVEEIDKRAEKRAKCDEYWAKLLQGERCQPQGPLQMRSLQQFAEVAQKKHALERQIKGVKRELMRLLGEKKEIDQMSQGPGDAIIAIGGTLFLDVTFEVEGEMGKEDGDLQVNFEYDGIRFNKTSLSEARKLLLRQVNAYREKESANASDRQAAIDKMFEGQGKKPTAPQMEDKLFELHLNWADGDNAKEFEVQATLAVSAAEPAKVMVKNTARLHVAMERVQVQISSQGARANFALSTIDQPLGQWRQDADTRAELAGIAIGDKTALSLVDASS